ncbi:MAG: M20/M25/M40 family metallo-hydrolase [Candidatus Eremiobacteraeota bacterium]|nr:M20/M25/M40 family metallo-hydrolase [Candidatus Eremiobacteraeota bacterium]
MNSHHIAKDMGILYQPASNPLAPGKSRDAGKKQGDGVSISHVRDTFRKDSADKSDIRKAIQETKQDWKRKGKKLGMVAAASAATYAAPAVLATLFPALAIAAVPAGVILGLVVAGLEEKNIGLGKRIGGFIGDKAGVVGGLAKGMARRISGKEASKQAKVILPKRKPTGAKAKEPILQSLLHGAEKKITGKEPKISQSGRTGESIGTIAVSASSFLAVPIAAAVVAGGPVGIVLGSALGGILGLVGANIEENFLGVGRVVGEVAGRAVGMVKSGVSRLVGKGKSKHDEIKEAVPASSDNAPKKKSRDPLMDLNNIISEPIMGVLMDTAVAGSRLFQEKPVQTIDFDKRPDPKVNQDRLLNNFRKLAGIDGTSGNEKAVGKELRRQLDLMGISHKSKKDGTIIATIPGTVKDAPSVLLCSHQDTVSSTSPDAIIFDGREFRSDEKHILGSDDRAGIAEIMEGVATVIEKGLDRPEIKIVFTVGEEQGLKGSSRLKPEEISNRPTLGFVMDAMDKRDLFLKIDGPVLHSKSARYNFSQEDPLIQVAMKSMADAGIKPRPIHAPPIAGAQSDANTEAFNSGMIRSLAVGTGASDIHTTLENIKAEDLEQVANSVVGFISNACDLKVDDSQQIIPRYPIT